MTIVEEIYGRYHLDYAEDFEISESYFNSQLDYDDEDVIWILKSKEYIIFFLF